ncbi:MAG TPA: hypothetical protein DIT83_01010 [Barnesiella intestinihominis]|nr:hypothetical protein [Barnesiella intestinihominis]
MKNKLLANYLRNRGNELATVRISAFCVAVLSNNSFYYKSTNYFLQCKFLKANVRISGTSSFIIICFALKPCHLPKK